MISSILKTLLCPLFASSLGEKSKSLRKRGKACPPLLKLERVARVGKIDGASHLRPGPLEPRMATVLLVPPISSALRTRFSKKENKQLMDSGAPKVCCFILFVTGNVRMRMRRHELLAARRVFLQENLIFLGMKTVSWNNKYVWPQLPSETRSYANNWRFLKPPRRARQNGLGGNHQQSGPLTLTLATARQLD